MTSISDRSTYSPILSVLSAVPTMQYSRSFSQASPRIRAECSTLLMMIGRMALSSKLPWLPANATQLSSPSTWMQTITMASHWVGFTLPGMIDEPGSLAGRISSLSPQRGPEASQRMSLAIFISGTASPRSAGVARDHGVEAALGGELVGRGHERLAGQLGDLGRTSAPKPGGAFRPVPTAVPPMASSYSPPRVDCEPVERLLELGGVAGPLLADGERHGVLEVGAADLDHVVPLLGLGLRWPPGGLVRAGAR